jgi:hypothetical protein
MAVPKRQIQTSPASSSQQTTVISSVNNNSISSNDITIKQEENREDKDLEAEEKHVIEDAIDTCERYLCSDRHDLNQLAMESLVYLTDTKTTSLAKALYVAQRILLPVVPVVAELPALQVDEPPKQMNETHDCNHHRHHHIHHLGSDTDIDTNTLHFHFVHALRCCSRMCRRRSVIQRWNDDVEDVSKNGPGDEIMTLRTVTVLWNSLQLLSDNYSPTNKMTLPSSPTWHCITSSLQNIVTDVESDHHPTDTTTRQYNPQAATMATDCLRVLEDMNHMACTK